eukprot:366286-Chlamydomonas_euryale.AAC.8
MSGALVIPCTWTQEYQRAAYVLQDVHGHHAEFLRFFSIYLSGEKRKEYVAVQGLKEYMQDACPSN